MAVRFLIFIFIIDFSYGCPPPCSDSTLLDSAVEAIKKTYTAEDKLLAEEWATFKDEQKEVSGLQGKIFDFIHSSIKLKNLDVLSKEKIKLYLQNQNRIYFKSEQ